MRLAEFVQRQNEKHAAILPPTMRGLVLAEAAELVASSLDDGVRTVRRVG